MQAFYTWSKFVIKIGSLWDEYKCAFTIILKTVRLLIVFHLKIIQLTCNLEIYCLTDKINEDNLGMWRTQLLKYQFNLIVFWLTTFY